MRQPPMLWTDRSLAVNRVFF